MVNEKAQESAPFELLIAVVIMCFVLAVGITAMGQFNCDKCYGETNAKMEEMKTKIETVVTQKSPQTASFRLGSCFKDTEEAIRIRDFSDPQFCVQYCGSAKTPCIMLQYNYTGKDCGAFSIMKCLGIAPDAVFAAESGEDEGHRCKAMEKMELVNFRENIPQGNYLLLNKSRANDQSPTICAYLLGE